MPHHTDADCTLDGRPSAVESAEPITAESAMSADACRPRRGVLAY